jgi:hypothetical protein
MSAPILIDLTPEAKARIAAFEQAPDTIRFAIAKGMDKALPEVASNIQAQRLTGLGPFPVEEHKLGIRSGQLRESVRWTPSVIEGDSVTGSIGSQVRYAAVHEFGFDGDVQVKPFFRKYRGRDRFARVEHVSPTTGRKYRSTTKTASGVSGVGSHTRHMRIPGRAPFGYGVQDNVEMISTTVSEAVTATFRNL